MMVRFTDEEASVVSPHYTLASSMITWGTVQKIVEGDLSSMILILHAFGSTRRVPTFYLPLPHHRPVSLHHAPPRLP